MALDFPSSPNIGDTFPGPSSSWAWDGRAWNVVPMEAGGDASVYAGDTPPAEPKPNELWFNTATGVLYIYYTDADSSQFVQVSASPQMVDQNYARKTARARNIIRNPVMQISQENGTNAVWTSGGYPADQWQVQFSGITASAFKTQNMQTPENTSNAISFSASVAKPSLAATDYLALGQPIEGQDLVPLQWPTVVGVPAILVFSVYANKTGMFCYSICNAAANRSFVGSFEITAAYTPQKVVAVIPPEPKVTAAWPRDTSLGAYLRIATSVGSDFIGLAGWQDGNKMGLGGMSNGAIAPTQLYVTDVGLYADIDKTGVPPPFMTPAYDDDLRACMRYWEPLTFSSTMVATAASQLLGAYVPFVVPKRQTPTIGNRVNTAGAANATWNSWQQLTQRGVASYSSSGAAGVVRQEATAEANARM